MGTTTREWEGVGAATREWEGMGTTAREWEGMGMLYNNCLVSFQPQKVALQ